MKAFKTARRYKMKQIDICKNEIVCYIVSIEYLYGRVIWLNSFYVSSFH